MIETPRVPKTETADIAEPKTVEGKAILKEITSLREKLQALLGEKETASETVDNAKHAGRSGRVVAELDDVVVDLAMRISSAEAQLAELQTAYVKAEERGKSATYEPADERVRKLHVLLESCMQDIATLQNEQRAIDASLEELNRELALAADQQESIAALQAKRDFLEERALAIEFELEKSEKYKEDLQVAYRKVAFSEEFRKTTH